MRPLILTTLVLLFAGTAVAAPFRTRPPASMALLEAAPKPAPSPQGGALLDIQVDPHAGSFVGKEVGVGAAMVFATDLVCIVGGGGTALAALAIGGAGSNTAIVVAVVGGAVFALIDLAVSPMMAALGAYWMSTKEGNNGLFGAMLGAYVTQAVSIATGFVVYLGAALLTGALFAASGGIQNQAVQIAGSAAGLVGLVVVLALHYVALPMGASFGIHWTQALNEKRATRRPDLLPANPTELYANKREATPILAFQF